MVTTSLVLWEVLAAVLAELFPILIEELCLK